jgi:ACT domain-containing protein
MDLDPVVNFFVKIQQEEKVEGIGEIELSGICPRCSEPYSFSGKMFSHLVNTRIKEGVEGLDEITFSEIIELSEEEAATIERLREEEKLDELERLIQSLLAPGDMIEE